MSKPKPIKISNTNFNISISGYKDKRFLSYIQFNSENNLYYGYLEDRDLKRLKKWVDYCIRNKK